MNPVKHWTNETSEHSEIGEPSGTIKTSEHIGTSEPSKTNKANEHSEKNLRKENVARHLDWHMLTYGSPVRANKSFRARRPKFMAWI